jgi:hypothetical protein
MVGSGTEALAFGIGNGWVGMSRDGLDISGGAAGRCSFSIKGGVLAWGFGGSSVNGGEIGDELGSILEGTVIEPTAPPMEVERRSDDFVVGSGGKGSSRGFAGCFDGWGTGLEGVLA